MILIPYSPQQRINFLCYKIVEYVSILGKTGRGQLKEHDMLPWPFSHGSSTPSFGYGIYFDDINNIKMTSICFSCTDVNGEPILPCLATYMCYHVTRTVYFLPSRRWAPLINSLWEGDYFNETLLSFQSP